MCRRGPHQSGNPAQNSELGGEKDRRTEFASKVRPWRVNKNLETVKKQGIWEAHQNKQGTFRLG